MSDGSCCIWLVILIFVSSVLYNLKLRIDSDRRAKSDGASTTTSTSTTTTTTTNVLFPGYIPYFPPAQDIEPTPPVVRIISFPCVYCGKQNDDNIGTCVGCGAHLKTTIIVT